MAPIISRRTEIAEGLGGELEVPGVPLLHQVPGRERCVALGDLPALLLVRSLPARPLHQLRLQKHSAAAGHRCGPPARAQVAAPAAEEV